MFTSYQIRRNQQQGSKLTRSIDIIEEDAFKEDLLQKSVERKAASLAKKYPELATEFMAFAASQQAENDYMQKNLQDVIWILQRAK